MLGYRRLVQAPSIRQGEHADTAQVFDHQLVTLLGRWSTMDLPGLAAFRSSRLAALIVNEFTVPGARLRSLIRFTRE
jgi:hypothetical protein